MARMDWLWDLGNMQAELKRVRENNAHPQMDQNGQPMLMDETELLRSIALAKQNADPTDWQTAVTNGWTSDDGLTAGPTPPDFGDRVPIDSQYRVEPDTHLPADGGFLATGPPVNDPILGASQPINALDDSSWLTKYGPYAPLLMGGIYGAAAGGLLGGAAAAGGAESGIAGISGASTFGAGGADALATAGAIGGAGATAGGITGTSTLAGGTAAAEGITGTSTLAGGAGGAAAGSASSLVAAGVPATALTTEATAASWLATALGISPGAGAALVTALGGIIPAVASVVNGKITADNIESVIGKQADANTATALQQNRLNNPNVNTPFGSSTWTEGPDGRPINTQTLSPEQQILYNKGTGLASSGLDIAQTLQGQIGTQLQKPFGLDGRPDRVDPAAWGAIQGSLDFSPAGAIQKSPGTFDPIQKQLDFSGAPAMPGADADVRDQVARAFFMQQYNLLNPQFRQQQNDLDSMLSAQGIARDPGQDGGAWQREQDNLARSQMTSYNDLANRAVISGGDAMAQLFGMQLGARQQGVGEATTMGNYANAAQGQGANQQLASMGAVNQAQLQGANQIAAAGNFWNQAQGQTANQALAAQQANNTARGQEFGEMAAGYTTPLNAYNAFLSGGQVQNPAFPQPVPTTVQPQNLWAPTIGASNAMQTGIGQGINYLSQWLKPAGS